MLKSVLVLEDEGIESAEAHAAELGALGGGGHRLVALRVLDGVGLFDDEVGVVVDHVLGQSAGWNIIAFFSLAVSAYGRELVFKDKLTIPVKVLQTVRAVHPGHGVLVVLGQVATDIALEVVALGAPKPGTEGVIVRGRLILAFLTKGRIPSAIALTWQSRVLRVEMNLRSGHERAGCVLSSAVLHDSVAALVEVDVLLAQILAGGSIELLGDDFLVGVVLDEL